MAITTALCNSFKRELLGGIHDLDTDTIKVALIASTHTGTYNASVSNYSDLTDDSDEVIGAGYTVGGPSLDGASITLDGSTAFVDFSDEVISTATISASGALLYNSSKEGRAIAVLDFGGTKISTNGDFTIVFPASNSTDAIIRIS